MIKNKTSVKIINYENNGQLKFFGKDNLSFKTVNLSKKQRFDNICNIFKLKKIVKKTKVRLTFLIVN